MESSIAVFLMRWSVCELPPTAQRSSAGAAARACLRAGRRWALDAPTGARWQSGHILQMPDGARLKPARRTRKPSSGTGACS